eukprot:Phypoly_transcript_09694.p1 GENE.Phypoly_transcript_09694~~Phypoly_transcript_09694.p1  ORF type:complete len:141 (-),score=18.14 Phypoly_transcript_09694:125-547(-)
MSNPTEGYRLHHTMIRVKDPVKSREFYEKLLGMTLIAKKDFEAGKFTLYFYTYLSAEQKATIPNDEVKAWDWIWTHRGAFVELTHNWGTETDPDFKGYHSGNQEPRGFGHLAVAVPDVYACVARLEKEGVRIIKAPDADR